ncbi:MAG: ribosome small subunit-dependent GTPase A [Salinivirgaceae bacterium]|nr:ribosome small subunit-dependent GTPase A [Salinivirgaceae bacterium]
MKQGLVLKSTGSSYQVKSDNNEIINCKIRGKFRTKGIKTTNPIAVGDIVDFKFDDNSEFGIISKIHPRKNYIIRKSINLSKQAHILAANIDQAVLMVTLAKPKTYPEFIDRFLVSAEAYQIPAKIIFNKIDLYDEELIKEMGALMNLYEGIGYGCFQTSAKKGIGIDEVKELLKDKISVISGHSGIGKSSLINTIQPSLNLKTSEISDYHESGKHTTTFPEMHELSKDSYIIDTPGIKGLGMVDMEKEEIAHYFPEMFKALKNCQFYNCTHSHEPNCAVKLAVENGTIKKSRYKSYLSILAGDEDEKFRSVGY